MTHEQEQQIWEFMGEIRNGVKHLNERFSELPCKSNRKDIDELQDYKNQMIGRVSIISMVFGILGYAVSVAVNWLINK